MSRFTGCVEWFNVKKGYGFIKVHNNDEFTDKTLFCHQSNISPVESSTFRKLFPGEYISFEISKSDEKNFASNITGINGGPLLIDNESYNFKFFPKNRQMNNDDDH
jgi:cold shock CspA family protein